MRDIWLCDIDGRLDESVEPVGLSSEVWRQLYPVLSEDEQRPLLSKLWQHHWGAEGDALMSLKEVQELALEVASVSDSPDGRGDDAVALFLQELGGHIALAIAHGAGLRFVAD